MPLLKAPNPTANEKDHNRIPAPTEPATWMGVARPEIRRATHRMTATNT